MASWGGGRARGRQNDSPWRRGWSQSNSSILTEGSPKVNLTECFVLSGTQIRFQQNASFCCKQAAYGLPCFNRFPFNPLLLNCCHTMQQILLNSVGTRLSIGCPAATESCFCCKQPAWPLALMQQIQADLTGTCNTLQQIQLVHPGGRSHTYETECGQREGLGGRNWA